MEALGHRAIEDELRVIAAGNEALISYLNETKTRLQHEAIPRSAAQTGAFEMPIFGWKEDTAKRFWGLEKEVIMQEETGEFHEALERPFEATSADMRANAQSGKIAPHITGMRPLQQSTSNAGRKVAVFLDPGTLAVHKASNFSEWLVRSNLIDLGEDTLHHLIPSNQSSCYGHIDNAVFAANQSAISMLFPEDHAYLKEYWIRGIPFEATVFPYSADFTSSILNNLISSPPTLIALPVHPCSQVHQAITSDAPAPIAYAS